MTAIFKNPIQKYFNSSGELDGLELSSDAASASLESALPDLFNYDIYSAFTDTVSDSKNAKTAIPPVIVGDSSVPPNKAPHPGVY